MDTAKQYHTLLPKLTTVLSKISQLLHQEFQKGFVIETNIKTLHSISRKCREKDCKDITELSDVIRGRLFFPQPYTYDQTLHQLIKLLGSKIKKIDWKKTRDHGLKYRGIVHLDIQMEGINFELQVIPLGFRPFVEPQHKIYEILRDDVKIDKDTKERLIKMHNQMFDMLEDKYMV